MMSSRMLESTAVRTADLAEVGVGAANAGEPATPPPLANRVLGHRFHADESAVLSAKLDDGSGLEAQAFAERLGDGDLPFLRNRRVHTCTVKIPTSSVKHLKSSRPRS